MKKMPNKKHLAAVLAAIFVFASALAATAFAADKKDPGKEIVKQADYAIYLDVSNKGGKGTAKITVKVGAKYHVNKEYPLKLQLEAGDGVKFDKNPMKTKDAKFPDEKTLVLETPFTGAAGLEVKATIKFGYCDDSHCPTPSETFSFKL